MTKKILGSACTKADPSACAGAHAPAGQLAPFLLFLPNFDNRIICLRFSTTILQIANSYLYAKYLLE